MIAVFLAPGAGGGPDHPTLRLLESELDVPVRLYDFEYRRAGRRAAPRADRVVPEFAAAVESYAAELGTEPADIVVGGRSYGGRVASMAVAGGLRARGLLLLSYPLHPPSRPEALRTEHFPAIEVPALFLSGDRDEFGTPDELVRAVRLLGGPVDTVWLEGGRHNPSNRTQKARIVAATRDFVARLDDRGDPGDQGARRPRD